MYDFAKIQRLDPEIYKKAKEKGDQKFGSDNSYVKNLYINNLYKKMGGKSKYPGKKPSNKSIEKSISAAVVRELFKIESYKSIAECSCDDDEKHELMEDIDHIYDMDDEEDIEDYIETIWNSDKTVASKEKKTLNKPFRTPGGPKKFSVYVKNDKGNIVKVNFGDPNMKIKRDDPGRRKSFRSRHNCENPGPKWKARYWSCRQWRPSTKVEATEQSIKSNYPEMQYTEVNDDCDCDCD